MASDQTTELDEQEKDGLPGHGLLHRQAEQQTQQRRRSLVLWNASSHIDRHGHDCPSAPAIQHSGGAHLVAALHRQLATNS